MSELSHDEGSKDKASSSNSPKMTSDEKGKSDPPQVGQRVKDWLALGQRLISRTPWKEDAVKGLKKLQTSGTSIVDRSFEEVELFRLRYQLDKIDQELFEAHQSLGKQCADQWTKGRPFGEDEREKVQGRIRDLAEEKNKLLIQIRAVNEVSRKDASLPKG